MEPLVQPAPMSIVELQFRPGVMARLGLGYETVSEESIPKIVYCLDHRLARPERVPMRDVAGHDLNYNCQHAGLARSLSMGTPGKARSLPPALISPISPAAPIQPYSTSCLHLREREKIGQGPLSRYGDGREAYLPFHVLGEWEMELAAGEMAGQR